MAAVLTEPPLTLNDALALLTEKDQVITQQTAVIDKKSDVIAEQKKRIALLEEYLRLERAKHYGRSSEKKPAQNQLFNEVELASCEGDGEESESTLAVPSKTKQDNGGRKPLSPSIPREQIHLILSDAEKAGAIDTFYTKVKEELDIIPAKVRVLEYLQEKAVFVDDGRRHIKAAPLPQHPLKRSIASIGLLAWVITAKYCDGLPLYRVEKLLERYGGSMTRTTLANWMIRLSLQLQPLINLLREHQMAGFYLQADETRIQVLKEAERSALSDKFMWVTLGGPPDKPATLFDYDPSRGKEVPLRLFEGFKGYLQVDGYSGYDAVCERQQLERLGCMDHARRYYTDAVKAMPKKQGNRTKKSIAQTAVDKLGKLYELETAFKDLTPPERYRQRQQHSVPLLNDFKTWVDENIAKVPPDSLTWQALNYSRNQWPRLSKYCEDGRLQMSNIRAENAIRPFVIGRKAWLFAVTPQGAKASAIYYSLVETAKANGLEPYSYLYDVLKRLPYAACVEDYEALLPWNIHADQKK